MLAGSAHQHVSDIRCGTWVYRPTAVTSRQMASMAPAHLAAQDPLPEIRTIDRPDHDQRQLTLTLDITGHNTESEQWRPLYVPSIELISGNPGTGTGTVPPSRAAEPLTGRRRRLPTAAPGLPTPATTVRGGRRRLWSETRSESGATFSAGSTSGPFRDLTGT